MSSCVLCPCVCATAPLTGPDVSLLARALRRLCSHSSASLAHLNLCLLPHAELIETVLAAAPRVSDLQVEVLTVARGLGCAAPPGAAESDPAGEFLNVHVAATREEIRAQESPVLASSSSRNEVKLPAFIFLCFCQKLSCLLFSRQSCVWRN